jgi:hypothetical protein
MTQGNIDWVYLDTALPGGLRVGDTVSAAAGGLPTYRVMAVADGRAWLKDDEHGGDCVMPLSTFHWKALRPPPGA